MRMSEEPQSLAEGRVAILGISYQDMRALGVTERHLSSTLFGHWDGDDWVQPESRIPLRRLLDALCLPPSWEIVSRPHVPTVWTEPIYASLSILLTSLSFPRVPEGTIPPRIFPRFTYTHHPVEGGEDIERIYDGLDMTDVEEWLTMEGMKKR
jgi:hypothetical protein